MKNNQKLKNYIRFFIWLKLTVALVIKYMIGKETETKRITELYPDRVSSKTDKDLPQKYRGLLENDLNTCTGCGECVSVCPTSCIALQTTPSENISKPNIEIYKIDYGKCLYCGLCVEVCLPQSLKHTRKFEKAVTLRSKLNRNFTMDEK